MKNTIKLLPLIAFAASPASAALILADSVTLDAGSEFYAASNLNATTDMNLQADGILTNDDFFTADDVNVWVTNAVGGDYFEDGGVDPVLTFSFNTTVAIDSVTVWGYPSNGGPGNSVKDGTVEFFAGAASLGTETLAFLQQGGTGRPGMVNDFATTYVGVTSATFTFTDNYTETAAGGDRIGAGTVAFNAIPEPSSTALLGLGGMALLLRRRK